MASLIAVSNVNGRCSRLYLAKVPLVLTHRRSLYTPSNGWHLTKERESDYPGTGAIWLDSEILEVGPQRNRVLFPDRSRLYESHLSHHE